MRRSARAAPADACDGARLLVSKDVGGRRYAITLNVADGTATGNVFSAVSAEGVVRVMAFTDTGGATLTLVGGAPATLASCNDTVLLRTLSRARRLTGRASAARGGSPSHARPSFTRSPPLPPR